LRFYGSNGVTVSGITIQNSPQTHLKFDNCISIQVSDFTTSSPGDSPNTDGIHHDEEITIPFILQEMTVYQFKRDARISTYTM